MASLLVSFGFGDSASNNHTLLPLGNYYIETLVVDVAFMQSDSTGNGSGVASFFQTPTPLVGGTSFYSYTKETVPGSTIYLSTGVNIVPMKVLLTRGNGIYFRNQLNNPANMIILITFGSLYGTILS